MKQHTVTVVDGRGRVTTRALQPAHTNEVFAIEVTDPAVYIAQVVRDLAAVGPLDLPLTIHYAVAYPSDP